jgi:hypothetical protein
MVMKRAAIVSLPFIFLILLGDGYQYDLVLVKVGLTQISIVLVLLYSLVYIKPPQKTLHLNSPSLAAFIILCGVYSFVGIFYGNTFNDIREDLIGIVYLYMIYYCVLYLSPDEIQWLWKIIIVASIVGVIKIFLVNYANYDITWANDWQARKDPLPGLNWSRIVLRGGDAYLGFAFISIFACLVYNKNKLLQLILFIGLLLFVGFGIFISLSRTSYIGMFLGMMMIVYFHKYLHHANDKYRILLISGMSLVGIFVIILTNDIMNYQELYLNRISTYDESYSSMDWRGEENEIVYESVKSSLFLGRGLGASFFIEGSLSDKGDGRSLYTHNIFTWILLKMGLPGLLIFIFIQYEFTKKYYHIMNQGSMLREDSVLAIILFTCFVNLFVISLTTNKYFLISGAMFLGLFFAYINITYPVIGKHENRN